MRRQLILVLSSQMESKRNRLLTASPVPRSAGQARRSQASVWPTAETCALVSANLSFPSTLTLYAADILTRIPDLFPHASSGSTSSSPSAQAPARHLAKYIFPRQFGLHNVFTAPKVQNSFEVLPDYDDRELDIKVSFLARGGKGELGHALTRRRCDRNSAQSRRRSA